MPRPGPSRMHELSIAMNVVDIAARHAAEAGDARVTKVTLHVGALAGVHVEALRHGFSTARAGTPLADAELRIVAVPVSVWCAVCTAEFALPETTRLACPACGRPTGDLRAGRELDLVSIELEATAAASEAAT